MLVNKDIAISTSSILLVPYEPHHVPTYHTWMQDPEILSLTASEPLSLAEEYGMQQSWRQDADKLTFIACVPPPSSSTSSLQSIKATVADGPAQMLGDINLFLTPVDEDPEGCIGELELMIAPRDMRRKGYGRAAVLVFLRYIQKHLAEIMDEYALSLSGAIDSEGLDVDAGPQTGAGCGNGRLKMRLLQLRVKIGGSNTKSINLFESIGFIKVEEGENYFGEVELLLEGFLGEDRTGQLIQRWGLEEYKELEYSRLEGSRMDSSKDQGPHN